MFKMMTDFTAIFFILIVFMVTIGWLWAFITLWSPNRRYAYSDGKSITMWGYWVDEDNIPLQLN